MPEFSVGVEELGEGIVIVKVTGYLDAHTFEQMESQISDLFDRERYRIIVDLEQVEYISSAGCGVFIGAISDAKDNDGNIVLLRPTPHVMEVFELLGLNQIFRFATTREEAIASFE